MSNIQRTLAEWTLPNLGELVSLEVYRNRDGFDSLRLGFDIDRKDYHHTEQFDADVAYIRDVIDPQAANIVREYFLGRMTGRPIRTSTAGRNGE